jgi:ubiquinone biosynthesis protein Coq4
MARLQISGDEDLYYKEGKTPAQGTTSLLSSRSEWLNSAVLRDLFAQESLRRNGDDIGVLQLVPEVMNEYHRLLDDDAVGAMIQRDRARRPDFAAWLDAGRNTLLDLDTADRYADGTLGAMLRDFYRATGFAQVLAYRDVEPANDYQRYTMQRALVHDLEHLVTGFGTDPAGEYGMMYLYMTQNAAYFTPELAGVLNFNHAYLSSTWTMRTALYYSDAMPAFMAAARTGLEMASRMKRPMPLEDWDRLFEYPIEEVRRALNVTPTDPGEWAWTEKAWRG